MTALMQAADGGNRSAADALFAALYSQLQRLARRELTRKGGPVSLSTITLLHEAYLEIA
ncbi:MAG: ECF-type sigma factor, partial [Candidatus Acidiferrales bacterium]